MQGTIIRLSNDWLIYLWLYPKQIFKPPGKITRLFATGSCCQSFKRKDYSVYRREHSLDIQRKDTIGRGELKEYQNTMTEIPIAPVIRIIRKTGADRVGNEAGEALADLMEQYGQKIAKEALKLASHAGRKTITAHDIRMAAEILS